MEFAATSFQECYTHLLDYLILNTNATRQVSPRGALCLESRLPVTLHIRDSSRTLLWTPSRRMNYHFMIAELMWMVAGSDDVRLLEPYMKSVSKFYDYPRTYGAYGPRLAEQLPRVVQSLQDDPDTRQAVVSLWRPVPSPDERVKDIPCTLSLQFLLRDGQLDLVSTMRSNDAWLGTPIDVFNFSRIQAMVAAGIGAQPGWIHHTVGSMHLYERDLRKATVCLNELLARKPPGDLPANARVIPVGNYLPIRTFLPDLQLLLDFKQRPSVPPHEHAKAARVFSGFAQPWGQYLIFLLGKIAGHCPTLELPELVEVSKREGYPLAADPL